MALKVFQVYERPQLPTKTVHLTRSSFLTALSLRVAQILTGSGALTGLTALLAAPEETGCVCIANMKDSDP